MKAGCHTQLWDQLGSVLKTMGVDLDRKKLIIAMLNGFPVELKTMITFLNAHGEISDVFTLENVKS